MSEFSNNIAQFFRSEAPTLDEYKKLIKESAVQEEWLNAVALYRKGIFALQKNDFNGLEIIRQANESLKKVLDTSKETVKINMKALNESIETFKKDSAEDLQLLKFNFGMLYEDCKKEGMKAILNEETFYEEEEIENEDDDKKEAAKDCTLTEEIPSDASIATEAEANVTPVLPTEPNAATTPPPATTPEPTATSSATAIAERKSGYQEGVNAGKAFAEGMCKNESPKKFGLKAQIKQAVQDHIKQNLYDQPYNFVVSFEEGFAAGVQLQERINQDMYPEEYAQFEEQNNAPKSK